MQHSIVFESLREPAIEGDRVVDFDPITHARYHEEIDSQGLYKGCMKRATRRRCNCAAAVINAILQHVATQARLADARALYLYGSTAPTRLLGRGSSGMNAVRDRIFAERDFRSSHTHN